MSDNELDAELLGMVGGESDDDGEELDASGEDELRSPSPKPSKATNKAVNDSKRQRGVAAKVSRRGRKKRKDDSDDEDDLDLG